MAMVDIFDEPKESGGLLIRFGCRPIDGLESHEVEQTKGMVKRAAVKLGLIPASAQPGKKVTVITGHADIALAVYVGDVDLYSGRHVSEKMMLHRLVSHLGGKFTAEAVRDAFVGRDLPASESEYVRMVNEQEIASRWAKIRALDEQRAKLLAELTVLGAKN